MLACILTITPLDKSTGARSTMRFSSAADRRVCGLNGVAWEPCMTRAPALGMQFWNGDFEAPTDGGKIAFSINLAQAKKAFPDITDAVWTGAQVEAFIGRVGAAWPWTSYFKGRITSYGGEWPTLDLSAQVDTEPFNVDVLTSTYAGTGGAEGGSDIKGKVKPLALGWPRNVEPVLINAVDSVYQFSAYGAIEAVETLYERASAFSASSGDYANYAALVAADIPAGAWATCLAEGMIRLGAPAFGVITGDIKGHKVGGSAPRGAGALVSALASIAGVSSSLIASSTLTALDAEGATNSDVMVTDQIKFLDAARRLILQCNWQALVSNAGVLAAMKPSLSGTELFTLHAQGKRTPLVTASAEQQVSLPYAKTTMAAERCWRVHTFDEISTSADLIDKGDYDAMTVYREGNIVSMPDGSRWVYIAEEAQAGIEPGTDPLVWEALSSALLAAFSARLVPENYIIPAGSDGVVPDLSGAVGIYHVDDSAGVPAEDVVFSVFEQSGMTVSIDSVTGAYAVDTIEDGVSFAIATLRAEVGDLTFDRTYTVTKAVAGAAAKTITLLSDRQTIFYDGDDVASPSVQTTTFTANRQNTTADVVWSITDTAGNPRTPVSSFLTITDDTATMNLAQFNSARNGSSGVIVTASVTEGVAPAEVTISDKISVVKVRAGTVARGVAVSANRQNITYDSTGAVNPSTQTTTFLANRQNLSFGAVVNWSLSDLAGNTVSVGYLSNSTGNSVFMTAANFNTARGSTNGVIVTASVTDAANTYTSSVTLVKVQNGAVGADGAPAKTLTVISDRQLITYSAAGSPAPSSQPITFTANKQNTTGTVTWSLTDMNGVGRSTAYLSAASGDTVTMTAANFDVARSGTNGVIVTGTITDGTTFSDKISVVKTQDGATGANGSNGLNAKTLTVISDRQVINYDDDGLPTPATQTTTFTTNKQNTTATVNWSITDAAGVSQSVAYLSSSTGDSVTLTEANFNSARNGTSGVIVTASITDGSTITDKISVTRVQAGANAMGLALTSTAAAFTFNGSGAASPSSQTITFTANPQNITGTVSFSAIAYSSSGTSLGAVTLSGSGNTRTMTNAQFTAPGVTAYVVVTASLGGYSDTCTVIKVSDGAAGANGANGSNGPAGLAAFLTNDSFPVPAYADGTVINYTGATGSFKVFSGSTDVSSNFTLATASGGNPQALTVSYVSQTYTITGGLDAAEDTANLTIRATGTGSYAGVTIDRVFSLGKLKGGYEIVATLPTTNLFAGRVVFLTSDGKLYRYTGAAWTATVLAADISGALADSQIAALAASKVTGALSDSQIAAISAAKVTGTLTDAQIAAIAAAKITGTITTTQITDDAITSAKIAANAVTASEIAAGAVVAGKIAADAITAVEIAAGAISTAELAAGAITTAKIAAGAITTTELAAGAITTAKIAAGAITTAELAAGAVTAAKIAANSITANEIATGAITADEIAAGAITAAKLAATSVITTSAQIADAVITSAKIGSLEVKSANIDNLTVGTGKIADNAVSQIIDAYTAGTLGSTVATANNLTAQSVSITATGAPIMIVASFSLRYLTYLAASSPCKVEAVVQIYRGANELTARTCEFVTMGAGDDITVPVALSVRNTPSAGTHTYTIKVTILDGNTEYFSVAGRSLTLMELKK